MDEYIKKETAIKRFEEIKEQDISLRDTVYLDGVMAIIENLPTADVVPVVRCHDCKHSAEPAKLTKIYGQPGTLTCHHGPCNRRNVNANDFCSYGERRDKTDG